MSKKRTKMNTCGTSLKEVWECFIISKTSKCVSDATLSNYHHHLRGIGKHLNIEMPLAELSKRDLERMVVSIIDKHSDGTENHRINGRKSILIQKTQQ